MSENFGTGFDTHAASNQPPPLENYNLYTSHLALREAVTREGASWADAGIAAAGAEIGTTEWIARGVAANRYPPELKRFDRFGNPLDTFEFHPAWHACLGWLKGHGVDTGAWADPKPGAHVRRAALFQLFAEIEPGALCPTTMTYGAVPAVSREPDLAAEWLPRLLSPHYDPRFLPAAQKTGAMMGMGMTEKQGGSDVRANTTRAEPVGDSWYRLVGHKWFFSASMSDAFLVTAQAPGGLTCFFLPRFTPDGRINPIRHQRAKDKLGDRSNAGAEVEFPGTLARRIGEEGRGIPTVIEMATYTRLDCANGTTGLMRAAVAQALHHAHHRKAFGARLVDQPLMRNVLSDLALEVEAAVALSMRIARCFDRQDDEAEQVLKRLLTPVAKYWICKRGANVAVEAMEVLGGNGYVEESPMPRLYRQMPLNSIWEGSGNIMCLDVLRAIARTPNAVDVLAAELAPALGRNPAFDRSVATLKAAFGRPDGLEAEARRIVEQLALVVQASLLIQFAPEPFATAFCASRLGGDWGNAFGTLPAGSDFGAIIERAWPQ
jgi:putative acyl-CoA dehydrogenase